MKKTVFFPGRVGVVFRKGPRGFLRQDPSDEARRIKGTPSLRDRSAPVKEELVRRKAISEVRVRGGDATDPAELLGEYLMSFLRYALSFKEISDLLQYEAQKTSVPTPAAEDDQLVGFGERASSTWREVWESRTDGYAAFILRRKCAPGTRMHKLQQYLQKRQQLSSSPVSSSSVSPSVSPAPASPSSVSPSVSSPPLPSHVPPPSLSSSPLPVFVSPPSFPSTSVSITSSDEPMEMEEDEELERCMLSISTEHIDTYLSAPATVTQRQQPSGSERRSQL